MADCCLIKKVATVEVYENKNEVRAYGFMAGDRNTPVMEVRFKHLWGESNLSSCKLRWIIVDDVGSLLVGEVPIQSDNTALINLPNELFTGDRRMKVQLTVASCDGERILNLQQFTDLKVINSLAPNEVVEPVYQILINAIYDESQKYLKELETSYTQKYGSLDSLYKSARASLEQYLITAENGGNAEFLQGYSPAHFQKVENTINDLIASTKYNVGDVVEVLGYYEKGDGAGHPRIKKPIGYNGADAVIGADGSIWGIVHSGEVNVSWFGAKGDGIADDSDYFNKAATYCYRKYIILCGEKEYLVSSELDFKQVPLNITGIFNNTVPLILGGQSQGFVDYNSKQYINRCNDVIVIGAKKQEIELTWAKNVILKAYSSRGVNQASIAYSTFVLHYTQSIKLLGDVAGDNQAWINENKFYLNDCKLFQIGNEDNSDNYIHNHNVIYGGTFEGGGESIKLYRCHSNMFYNLRLEGRTKIVFSGLSKWNIVRYSFVSSDTYLTTLYPIIVGDKSTNRVINEYAEDLRTIREYNINQFNIQEYIDSEKTTTGSVLLDGRVSLGAWGYFYSDFVEADKFTKFSAFVADGRDSGDGFRCGFETYDSNFNKISGTGYKMLVGGVGFVDSEQTAETNQHTHYVQSVDEYMKNQGNVKYIRFYSRASNCRGFNIGFKIETLNTGGKNDAVILESFRKPKPISTQLDTPYHASNMSKLGILESYHNYLTELHEYEKQQNIQSDTGVMNLNVIQPPVIPTEVEAYAKEYNLI